MSFQKVKQVFNEKGIIASLSIFGASAWLCIQVSHTVSPYLGLPSYFVRSIIITVIILFPLLIVHVYFDHNEETDITANEENLLRRINSIFENSITNRIILVIGIFLSVLFLNGIFSEANDKDPYSDTKEGSIPTIQSDTGVEKLAVLHFDNLTGDPSLAVIGPMISHWLTEGFIQNGDIKVASAHTIQRVYKAYEQKDNKEVQEKIKNETNASHIVDGSYFMQGDSIFIACELIEADAKEVLFTFGTLSGHKDRPLEIIENLREKVLGYWFNRGNLKRFPPPRFDSYKKFIEAQAIWGEDNSRVLAKIEESIAIDPSFYEPKFLELALLRNSFGYSKCDSIIKVLDAKKLELTTAQREKLNYFKYELAGDYNEAYRYLIKEFDRDPSDPFIRTSVGHFEIFNLNDYAIAIKHLEGMELDKMQFENCHYCQTGLYSLATAYYRSDQLIKALNVANKDSKVNMDPRILDLKFYIFIDLGKSTKIDELLTEIVSSMSDEDYLYYNNLIGSRYDILRDSSLKKHYLEKAIAKYENMSFDDMSTLLAEELARSYEMLGNYDKSLEIIQALSSAYPNNIFYKYRKLGLTIEQNPQDASVLLQDFKLNNKYDFGYNTYEWARIYAVAGDSENAIKYLEKSINNGRLFYLNFFENDWYLRSIVDDPRFKEIIKSRRASK